MTIEVHFNNKEVEHTVLIEEHEQIYNLETKIREALGHPIATKIVITLGSKRLDSNQFADVFYQSNEGDTLSIHILNDGSRCCCPDERFCFA